jgi:sugar phosphate isomerase/epimerase
VDFTNPELADRSRELLKNHRMEAAGLGVPFFESGDAGELQVFEVARRLGVTLLSVDFSVEGAPANIFRVQDAAAEYGMRLAIHNHGGRHWLGNAAILRRLFKETRAHVGLCLDTGWALAAGEDPIAMIQEFSERLFSLHLKDFVFGADGQPKDVITGAGNLRLKPLLSELARIEFNGPVIVEYEGEESDPRPALRSCLDSVAKSFATLQSAGLDLPAPTGS